MSVKFSNNAVTTLSASISAGATSFTVASASPFPTLASGDWTYVSLTSEVVKVTAISGTTFTCDATSAAHASGESVELRMTAELLNDFAEDTEALPKTGGAMTGAITTNSTFDGRDVATDGTKLDTIATSANNYSHPANHAISVTTGLQAALDSKAPLASPTLTGAPLAPTAAANTNTTQIATTAYVQTELTDLIGGAPGTLDTLNELAFAINDDASYASTLTTALATKVAKTSNQALSTAANALTISGTTITLARGDSTTDTISIPAGYADSDVDSHLSGGSGITYSAGAISVTSGSITAAHLAANSVDSSELVDNGVDASHLNVTGNGTTSQFLRSDGDGSFSWVTPTDTNTTYSVGDGGLSEINFTSADNTKLDGIATSANNYSYPYSVDQSTATSSNVTFNNVTVAGTLTESSAAIYKENISPLQDQLANIMRLNPVEYDKKSSGAHEYGLIAGEVLEIYPDFVGTKDGKADSLNYSRMVSVLVKAVQELTQKVEMLSK